MYIILCILGIYEGYLEYVLPPEGRLCTAVVITKQRAFPCNAEKRRERRVGGTEVKQNTEGEPGSSH